MSASFPTYQPRLLYIDLFCGAGGVTTGVSRVPGVQVVACVNHDATAIASHAANHPDALHYTEDIRTLDISPIAARVAMLRLRYPDTKVVLWASCECTNFSRAKGGKTRDPDSRSLAEHLYRYIKALQPDYIQIENVTEFLEWGPMLEKDGKLVPDKARKGESFKLWFFHILDMGYSGDWRIFNAADFGAYTSRKRLFVQFGRYGLPLAWPVPTHSRENWKPCRDVLDLDDFGQSIFTRKKPLCDATLRRLNSSSGTCQAPVMCIRWKLHALPSARRKTCILRPENSWITITARVTPLPFMRPWEPSAPNSRNTRSRPSSWLPTIPEAARSPQRKLHALLSPRFLNRALFNANFWISNSAKANRHH